MLPLQHSCMKTRYYEMDRYYLRVLYFLLCQHCICGMWENLLHIAIIWPILSCFLLKTRNLFDSATVLHSRLRVHLQRKCSSYKYIPGVNIRNPLTFSFEDKFSISNEDFAEFRSDNATVECNNSLSNTKSILSRSGDHIYWLQKGLFW